MAPFKGEIFRFIQDLQGEWIDRITQYVGFNALFEDGTIREAACWAHARRKFHDLHAARATPLTTEALRRIAELYVIEAEIRGKPPDERRQVRQSSPLGLRRFPTA